MESEMVENKFTEWMKSRTWEDYAVIAILIIFLIIGYVYVKPLHYTPGPMYGGDVFYHMGILNHLDRGGSFLENPQLAGEYPWNPYFFHILVQGLQSITSLPFETVFLYIIFIVMILSVFISYELGNQLFKRKDFALAVVVFFCIQAFYASYYKEFAFAILYPLLLLMLVKIMHTREMKYYIMAGFALGLIGITHLLGFIAYFSFTAMFFLYMLILRYIRIENKRIFFVKEDMKKYFKEEYLKIIVLFVIAIVIALIFWYKPIFVFKLQTPNDLASYDSPDLYKNYFSYLGYFIHNTFFSAESIGGYNIAYYILAILLDIFIIYALFSKNRSENSKFLMLYIFWGLVISLHYLITIPLIGKDYFGSSAGPHIITIAAFLGGLYGLMILFHNFKLKSKKIFGAVILFIIMFLFVMAFTKSVYRNPYYNGAVSSDIPSYIKDVSNWTMKNTNVDDVFISTNEISFMFSSVTGNKVMTTRRSFSGMFVDVDKRWADAAVILYGNNTSLRRDLINKYHIKYLYWQYNWMSLDYQFDNTGHLAGWFDPLIIKYNAEYEKYLKDNGVKFFRTNTWLDPAFRSNDYKQFDTLLVIPFNMSDDNPFPEDLKSMLKLKQSFSESGQEVARIYTIG